MSYTICPSCGEEIRLRHKHRIGYAVVCPYCLTDLGIVELDAEELDWVDYEIEEGWDLEEATA